MEEVSISVPGGKSMRAEVATPAGDGPHAAVIVIHEIFGLNDDIRAKAERLAGRGYVAVAPDLYSILGRQPLCVVRAMQSLRRNDGPAFEGLEAARVWLAARPDVDASRIGVIGFCMGGGFALLFAARAPLGAAAVFYGDVPKDETPLEASCPVVAGYGGRDAVFGRFAARLEDHLNVLGVENDIKLYPDAGHSYMSEHTGLMAKLASWGPMKVGFDPAAAEDSWRRVETFFAEHLGGE
ncbi:MAG: dienelactone hydrolase family protein [Chloroflexi bacterium]|nr:dienelactone hydrolase family protein [Chloroflexota bacterium]